MTDIFVQTDTIAAISTPLGEGGIGIVRLSGPKAFEICQKIYRDSKSEKITDRPSHTLHHGYIIHPQTAEGLDEVLISLMKSPHTYTTEDMIEINAHGGILVLQRILELVLKEGARLAEPGEFTRRAFLSGRIDLAQAEAVVDLIRARTDLAERCALQQLTGEFSDKIHEISDQLLDILAEVEARIDFPEEDLPEQTLESVRRRLIAIQNSIKILLDSAKFGKVIREGVRTVIIGKPNVGKSSLLNALLQESRAIVTPLPGTTRDTITESINIQGVNFLLTDTAGWRHTEDIVELEGVRRTQEALKNTDLIVMILDGSDELTDEDDRILGDCKKFLGQDKTKSSLLIVLNKIDLPMKIRPDQFADGDWHTFPVLSISAKTGAGIDQFKERLIAEIKKGNIPDSSTGLIVTNIRHTELLRKTQSILVQVRESLNQKIELECLSTDLRESLHYLGEITGQQVTSELLNRIFSRFCIGK